MTISARSILNVDTISKGNNKPWDKLMEYMATQPKGIPVEFDFRGIEVNQPCSSLSFMKILANPDFHMVLYNNQSTVNSIHLMCTLNGHDKSRIRNVTDVIPKKPTAEELAIERMAGQLMSYFVTNDTGTAGVLEIYKRFDQIGTPNTVKYIEAAIGKYIEGTGVKDVEVYTKFMTIQPGVLNVIVDMVNKYALQGITVTFRCDDKAIQNKLDLSLDLSKSNYSTAEKFNLMKMRLKVGRVGILTKYKESRAKDEFGRQGRGETAMSRVAIFKGFSNENGPTKVKFLTFNSNKFYTKDHWALEHDFETLDSLDATEILIAVDELGIYNDFIGSKYHFSACLQFSPDGNTTMYYTGPTGGSKPVVVTIPERAKMVFDDFGIEYERESLDAYILETRNMLDNM